MGTLKIKEISKWPIYGFYQILKSEKNRRFSIGEVIYHGLINGAVFGLLTYVLLELGKL